MAASATAICDLPSDQFRRHSSRTMTDRCRSWTRTQQGENMPILLKIQVERTAKTRLPRRRARVGDLCGFPDVAERVPTGSPKTGAAPPCGKTGNSTGAQRSGFGRKRRCSGMDETCRTCGKRRKKPRRAKSRDFGRCGEKAGQSRGVVRAPAAVTSARGAGSFGDLRGSC